VLTSRSRIVDTWLGALLFSTHPVMEWSRCHELRQVSQASSYLLRVNLQKLPE
jgi:hypothetical protein